MSNWLTQLARTRYILATSPAIRMHVTGKGNRGGITSQTKHAPFVFAAAGGGVTGGGKDRLANRSMEFEGCGVCAAHSLSVAWELAACCKR